MQTFEWVDATSVEEAASLLAGRGEGGPIVAKAGGIDLLDLMKEGIVRPSRIVNLRTIPGLDEITASGEGLSVGALTTLASLERAAGVRERYPALSLAAAHAATPQVRNAATIGGNLLQRPRCWYFRSAHFHREGLDIAEAAIRGHHDYHAIFDNAACAMVHASTPATALVAYDADVEIADGQGRARTVRVADFLLPPSPERDRDAAIGRGEVLTRVRLPAPGSATRSAYHKLTERDSYDWPICDVAVVLKMDGNRVADARIVLGWVAPVPRRAVAAEERLRGRPVTDASARDAATAAVEGATPLPRNAYKVAVLEAVVRRTIMEAAGS